MYRIINCFKELFSSLFKQREKTDTEHGLSTLMPKIIGEDDASYTSVEDLQKVLEQAEKQDIRNVALTGPFGSGKSSILKTLMQKSGDKFHFLPISLATLQANEEDQIIDSIDDTNSGSAQQDIDAENRRIENLNRKIEYSILQQIIYRENAHTVPNSRFRRIAHKSCWQLVRISLSGVVTVIAIVVLFKPQFFRVDSLYRLLDFSNTWNTRIDITAVCWLCVMLFCMFWYILKSYSNSKLNKLNLKDGEIEVVENNSIFNKHLDEILYFFQVTEYNAVILEDLDRFGTSNIFLKLRELCQLINESKIVNRHITFIYAIKDDVFKDEERTKFFDYITTVIPVINPSNSKDKLKAALKAKGYADGEISDEDLSEMAFFIQDMRILTNIVNEYEQYRKKLCGHNKQRLNYTKLLGMIVYKNYHPQDFAQLHRREGKVYACISKKRLFISEAIKTIDANIEQLKEEEKKYKENNYLKEKELRLILLHAIEEKCNRHLYSISISSDWHRISDIINSDNLFSRLLTLKTVSYQYFETGYYYPINGSLKLDIQALASELKIIERIAHLSIDSNKFKDRDKELLREKIRIKSLRLSEIIEQYNHSIEPLFTDIDLSPLEDVFLRRGYIDEDYYDYISYFYEGMVSMSDRDLLLNIKRQLRQPYDLHIDRIENFVKEVKPYMYKHISILNNDLLDYLASSNFHSFEYEQIMSLIERESQALDFLSQYYLYGKCAEKVFNRYISDQGNILWERIMAWNNPEEQSTLIEAYLKFGGELQKQHIKWLNNHYSFLSQRVDSIGLERSLCIADKCCFEQIDDVSIDLWDYLIEYDKYELNAINTLYVTQQLIGVGNTVTADNLNLTRVMETGNSHFIKNVKNNITHAIQYFHDKDKNERTEQMLYLLNCKKLDLSKKEQYLNGQNNKISDIKSITDNDCLDVALRCDIVEPSWENADCYLERIGQFSNHFKEHIEKHRIEYAAMKCSLQEKRNQELFSKLFGSNLLSSTVYDKLLNSFDCVFASTEELLELDCAHLLALIKNNKLPFEGEYIKVLAQTDVLDEYLLYYANAFIQSIQDIEVEITPLLANKLLSSEKFSTQEKLRIIEKMNEVDIMDASFNVDVALSVLAVHNSTKLSLDTVCHILKKSRNSNNRIRLAIYTITNFLSNKADISIILMALGGDYSKICEGNKNPTLEDTRLNRELLKLLKQSDVISSYKEDKKGTIRVYPKKTIE